MTPTQWRALAQFSFALFVVSSSNAYAAQVTFYPTGSVKQIQQATVRFSADRVAMGDPRSKIDPFTVSCNVATQKQPIGIMIILQKA